MPRHIEVISRGILRGEGKYLLCRNTKGGYYYLPGGHVEFGESAREALVREFLEETGERIRVTTLVSVSEASFVQKGKRRHEINFVFHVELRNRATPLNVESLEEHIEFKWASPSALRRLDVRPSSAKALLLRMGRSSRTVTFESSFASDE